MLALPLGQVTWLSLADWMSRSWLTAGSSGSATVAACAIDAQAKVSAVAAAAIAAARMRSPVVACTSSSSLVERLSHS